MQEPSTQNLLQNFTRIQISDLSLRDKLTIMWGWFWRIIVIALIFAIISMIVGGIVGFFAGLIAYAAKVDLTQHIIYFRIFGGIIGLIFAFISYFFLIKWLTKSRFGAYEFWLVKRT